MKDNINSVKRMERVDLNGLMDHLMLGIYQITTYTVMDSINSQTEESIQDNGRQTKWMVKVNLLGLMVKSI